jgi:peptidoglycan/LPS O-acetylase OafA/YrhL
MGVAFAVATVSWLLIEEPFRKLGGHIARAMDRNRPPRVATPRDQRGSAAGPQAALTEGVREGAAAD